MKITSSIHVSQGACVIIGKWDKFVPQLVTLENDHLHVGVNTLDVNKGCLNISG